MKLTCPHRQAQPGITFLPSGLRRPQLFSKLLAECRPLEALILKPWTEHLRQGVEEAITVRSILPKDM
jgi:hypothetical protein